MRRMADCLNSYGVATEVIDGGAGISTDQGALSQEQLADIVEECEELVDIDSLTEYEPLTVDELREIYAWQLTVADCLEEQGYKISEPTSVETFIDAYPSGEAWFPYNDIPPERLTQAEWDNLNEICPQYPANY